MSIISSNGESLLEAQAITTTYNVGSIRGAKQSNRQHSSLHTPSSQTRDMPVPRHDNNAPRISGSILSLIELPQPTIIDQILCASLAGVDMIHVDILCSDGVKTSVVERNSPTTSDRFTPGLFAQLRRKADIPLDIHIMDERPSAACIKEWIDVGVWGISVHFEAFEDKAVLLRQLVQIYDSGIRAGLACRPDVEIEDLLGFVEDNASVISLVNQNGVAPCAGGQSFNFRVLENIRRLKDVREQGNFTFKIMVDGGVEPEITGPKSFGAGADIVVAGSALFGRQKRDTETMLSAIAQLRSAPVLPDSDSYDIIADEIARLRQSRTGRLWISIEAFNGGGKTYTSREVAARLGRRGLRPVIVGLDLSWTDRASRESWMQAAYECRAKGGDHDYFHALKQSPEPKHWRKDHSDRMLQTLATCTRGAVIVEDCYQFNMEGDMRGATVFCIEPDSIVIVEGVYASALERQVWDLRIYINADREVARAQAAVRDKIKVRRDPLQTIALFRDVYDPSYDKYLEEYRPIDRADIVLDANCVGNVLPPAPVVVSAQPRTYLTCAVHGQQPISRINSCSRCGNDLRFEVSGVSSFLDAIDADEQSMWRYRKLLPVDNSCVVSDGEGSTPLRYLAQTSRSLGVNIWGKMETENPTGTFKDREASLVLSLSRQHNQTNLVMQSTGNTAAAISHYAGLAGIPTWAFIPTLCQYKLLMPSKASCAHLIAVDGHPIDVKSMAEDFATCFSFPKISPFYERCEANVTQGYEVAEVVLRHELEAQSLLNGGNFDYFVQTLSAGMGLIGFHEAMKRLEKWTNGTIRVPRILAVEISEFAPSYEAWRQGLTSVGEQMATPYFPDNALFEPTLWTTNIMRYYPYLHRMLKDSQGDLNKVTPDQVRQMSEKYGIHEELEKLGYQLSDTENATFVGFAGLAHKVEQGEIPKGSSILLMVTGKGFHANFVLERPDFKACPNLHGPRDILIGSAR